MIYRSIFEDKILEEFQEKIHFDVEETRLVTVLDLVLLYSYLLYEYCKTHYDKIPTFEDIKILNDLMINIGKYLYKELSETSITIQFNA